MELVFIRHGKTQGNLEGRYVGRTDEGLLPEWKEKLSRSSMTHYKPDIVFVSPMKRCIETVEALFGYTEEEIIACAEDAPENCPKALIVPELREMDFGDFEYKNYEELKDIPAYQAWIDSGGEMAFPRGEPGMIFRYRSVHAFRQCVQVAEFWGAKRVAFVTHGGVIMSIMSSELKDAKDFYSYQVKNGCGYIVQHTEAGLEIVCELFTEQQS